jgi:hypothetical protein
MTALNRKKGMIVIVGVVFLLAFGCAYGRGLTYTEGGTLLGALYGAGIGAAIGSASGHAGEGAGIGGLVGSLIGGALGYGLETGPRYGYGPYDDPYYDPYHNHPYYDEPTYRGYGGYGGYGAPSTGRDPYNRYDPAYGSGGPAPSPNPNDAYAPADTTAETYSEDYYQKQNRRLMSPGYDVP